ncbi:MAG: radical SAM protein [Candidatus Omnitrophica bacterium]|nr:radical SAM protein [Candidatus Omnitrophota bacterium]
MIRLILKNINYNFISKVINWHFNYYILYRGFPLQVGVYITERCNLKCLMCNIWKIKEPATYPFHYQKKMIDALARIGCIYYSISGGEPTLVEDLAERLSYACYKLPYVHLVTNGVNINKDLAKIIGQIGLKEISISLDGTEEYHNFLRGSKDAFGKAWQAIDLISTYAPKVTIVLNSLLSFYNIKGLRELNHRLSKFPNIYLKYLPFSKHKLFINTDNKFHFEKGNISDMDDFLNDALKNPHVINSSIFLYKAKLFFRGIDDLLPEQKFCLYPYFSLQIDPRGFIYPCIGGMDNRDGLPPDIDIERYLNSKYYKEIQRKLKNCKRCNASMLLCYYEPRLNFPIDKFIYYNFIYRKR